jgi:hypothetical protein
MVRDPHDALTDAGDGAPPMLRRPADAPPPLGPVSDTDPVVALRRVWSDGNASTKRSLRSWAGRISGRADRRLLVALVGATEAVVTHCDLLADRLTAQEAVTQDVAESFGQEIVQLRAEVLRLQTQVTAWGETQAGKTQP